MSEGILSRFNKTGQPASLGFFGGTFTAMRQEEMIIFLRQAMLLKKEGAVDHVRCSTRPDFINQRTLSILDDHGLDMIELGIQSFDDNVLAGARRGYSGKAALKACILVKQHDLQLGVQLLPGLPGSSAASFSTDITITLQIIPQAVRIYPCLVLKHTPLAAMMNKGLYRPWSLQATVSTLSLGLLRLWREGVPVIRIGLSPEKDLADSLISGPWHPALGSICRSLALKMFLFSRLARVQARPAMIYIPEKCRDDFWGHRKMNEPSLIQKGITRDMVRTWGNNCFRIYYSRSSSSSPAIV